jgi:hypothetical protein
MYILYSVFSYFCLYVLIVTWRITNYLFSVPSMFCAFKIYGVCNYSVWCSVWCGVAQYGAALLSWWCGVAQHGAALLMMVRRCSEWCGVAQHGAALLKWCGVAQLVERRLAVRQARSFSARHHREVFPLSFKAMKRWRETSANGDG